MPLSDWKPERIESTAVDICAIMENNNVSMDAQKDILLHALKLCGMDVRNGLSIMDRMVQKMTMRNTFLEGEIKSVRQELDRVVHENARINDSYVEYVRQHEEHLVRLLDHFEGGAV